MFKSITLAIATLAVGTATLAPIAAEAQRYDGPRYERSYGSRAAYRAPRYRHAYRNRRCDAGTGGAVIGAIAGGLLGNTVAGRGDRTLGTVVGAVGGGLAGRAIDRSDNPRRCR